MPADLLPARPDLADGEALNSYITRLADANGLRTSHLLPRPINVGLTAARAAFLATVSGMPVEQLGASTLDRYPPAIRGKGDTRRGGWRLHGADWVCPRCTPLTGITGRDWALALHPICRACSVLLTHGPTPRHHQTADRDLVDVVDAFRGLAEDTITRAKAKSSRGGCSGCAG